jgi:hypothetical protein
MSKQDAVIFGLIAQAPNATVRDSMLGNLALVRGIPQEEAAKLYEEFEAKNAEKNAKARRKAMIERLGKEAESITLHSSELADFVARVVKVKGSVTINPDLSLSVSLPKSGGGTGGGRVANDHPQPYVDSDGNRVLGPITFWLNNAFGEAEQKKIEGVFRPNGKRRSGSALAKALVEAGVLTPCPVE